MNEFTKLARILLVEDEALVAFEMADLIEELGFSVVGPSLRLEEALALAEREEFDVAFLDVNLGNGDTSEPIVEILRSRQVPYAFVSAYDEDQIGFRFPDDPVLEKPVTGARMLSALKAVLPYLDDVADR